ncbi:MAG: SDR family NAD(P)-dependent oxidoreductase [Geminicoccaceae bacterium]
MRLLENKVAVITGGARANSIGRATATLFRDHGATLAILDLDGEGAADLASNLGADHVGIACDVADAEAVNGAIGQVHDRFQRIDIACPIAGVSWPGKIAEITDQDYDRMLDVNLRGTFHLCRAVVPAMKQAGGGAIVCMASVAAQRGGGIIGGAHYAAAKGGVLGLMRAMARELGPDRIRVNAVCPSYIETNIGGDGFTDADKAKIAAVSVLGRNGRPEEVASTFLFLASDLASFITGATIDVNGGVHIR